MESGKELELMQAIYDRIYDMLTYGPQGKESGFSKDSSIFQMVPGGIPINPEDFRDQLTPINPNGNYNAAEYFSRMIDPIPKAQASYVRGSANIDNTYGGIIKNSNCTTPVDEEGLKIYKEAYSFLNTVTKIKDYKGEVTEQIVNTPIYENYIENRSAYVTAVSAYRNAYNDYDLTDPKEQKQWQANEPMLNLTVQTTYNKWRSQGAKQVEEALNALETTINRAVAAIIASDKETYEKARLASSLGMGDWRLSYPMPSNWCDEKAKIFNRFTLNSKKMKVDENSKFQQYGGKTSFGWGLWSVDASVEHSSEENNRHTNCENIEIKMEIAVVNLVRPWFDGNIFRMEGWHNDAYPSGKISSGKFDDVNAAMPLVPTGFVIVKNVEIKGDFKGEDEFFAKQSTTGGASIGYGPFRLGGHYSEGDSQHTFNSKYENGTITIPGMQIIGFISEVIPYSPK